MVRVPHVLRKADSLFWIAVVLPTLAALVYFTFLASDVYVSESRFVVRSPDKPATSGLGVFLKSAGFSNAGDEIYAAQDYVRSRDALRELDRGGAIAAAYGSDRVSLFNRFNPLGFNNSFEELFDYYLTKVTIEQDAASSITTLTVRAFSPGEAYRVNRQLLDLSEALVNRLNKRGRADLVEFGEREVADAERNAQAAALALAAFRNEHGIIDPEKQATVQLQMISKLQDELIGARLQLLQLRAMAPANPQIPILQVRITGLAREIDVQLGKVAGGRRSLSETAVRFQRLQLERDFADRSLAAAMTSMQDARSEARRKQAYVERIVQPNLPDDPQEPRRLRGIIAVLALMLIGWAILSMLIAGVREHGQ